MNAACSSPLILPARYPNLLKMYRSLTWQPKIDVRGVPSALRRCNGFLFSPEEHSIMRMLRSILGLRRRSCPKVQDPNQAAPARKLCSHPKFTNSRLVSNHFGFHRIALSPRCSAQLYVAEHPSKPSSLLSSQILASIYEVRQLDTHSSQQINHTVRELAEYARSRHPSSSSRPR